MNTTTRTLYTLLLALILAEALAFTAWLIRDNRMYSLALQDFNNTTSIYE